MHFHDSWKEGYLFFGGNHSQKVNWNGGPQPSYRFVGMVLKENKVDSFSFFSCCGHAVLYESGFSGFRLVPLVSELLGQPKARAVTLDRATPCVG